MRLPLKTAAALLAVTALTAACNPFAPKASAPQHPRDPRFATFTYETDDELKVQERIDSFNERMPELGATEGHVVSAHFRDGADWLPTPDRQYWVTGVATVPDTTIAMLTDDNIGESALLPGIHPSLYEYVPEECSFTTVDPTVANKVLGTDPEAIYSDWGSFEIREFAVSAQCNLIIVTGDGLNA
ncbi:MAG: hypothetical protein ACTTI9_03815 [Schaalia odontolytica]